MKYLFRNIMLLFFFSTTRFIAFSQENIKSKDTDFKLWFSQHWIWLVASIIVLIILAVLMPGTGDVKRTTTFIKDENGKIKSITITEIRGKKV